MSKTIKSAAQIFKENAGCRKEGGADAFYQAPSDVGHGVSIPSGGRGDCAGLDVHRIAPSADLKGPAGWFADPDDAFLTGGTIKGFPTSSRSDIPPHKDFSNQKPFEEANIPPPKPGDSNFKFEVTTQYVESEEPHKLGNFLLDFYNTQVSATYLKDVCHHKYAIKTDVFVDTMMCTMKTRIYKLGETQYAIEFQRRNGDTVAFNGTYQKVCQYLRKRAAECKYPKVLQMEPWEESPSIFSFEPLDIPDGEEIQITKEEMMPLLDMTSLKGAPWLQAEAATSLSKMAEEGNKILHDDRVFQSIHELVQVDSTDVAHPTSCLVWHLAGQEEAQPFLASAMIPNFGKQILLMTILWKILLDVTHPQVKAKLAQALNLSLKKQTERLATMGECSLGAEEAETMSKEIDKGFHAEDMGFELINEMQQAHFFLETMSKRGGGGASQ